MISIAKKTGALLASALIAATFIATPAKAQGLNNKAWSPETANRASIAALIRQAENGDGGGSAIIGTGSSNVTQLICGSNSGEGAGASSNAQANSSCIILNNSDGALNIDQDSDGDQNADTSSVATTQIDETINNNGAGGAEDVLAVLAGN